MAKFHRQGGSAQIRFTFGSFAKSYPYEAVSKVVFYGGDGNDRFFNKTSVPSEAHGNNGDDSLSGGGADDLLVGGYGQDSLYGNAGDDTILGSGGSDYLDGGSGADLVRGHGGQDYMRGGKGADRLEGGSGGDTMFGDAGADHLYGGDGNDKIYGNSGMDTIVSIQGGHDVVNGGAQWDSVWVDSSDSLLNVSAGEKKLGYVNQVGSFHKVSSPGSGPCCTVSTHLLGQNLPDPDPRSKHLSFVSKTNFKDRPLFSAFGASKDDVFQGSVGDCYFLAALSIVADSDPEHIRKMVVDLGDGTYAVRFYRGGIPTYVRVDADLYTNKNDSSDLWYADLGVQNSLWVPIIEKAYAVFRKANSSYDGISGGSAPKGEKYRDHLGLFTDSRMTIDDGLTAKQIESWYQNGSPDGAIKQQIKDSTLELLYWVKAKRTQGAGLLTGALGGISDATPIVAGGKKKSWRRGQHIYMIDRVEVDGQGTPTGIVLRDPYGSERTLSDFTRIHFCIGRASQLEADHG
ncbi:MAG: C2 family cysteine protease [Candidatus Binatia bacterium]|nr:C2 family cysteine protease [Candidatus Binatia bacterium]